MSHPNMIPVSCANANEMRMLAQQMRALCLLDPDKVEGYTASTTKAEADNRSAAFQEDVVASGHLRFIHYSPDGRIVNVVYTLLELESGEKEWNLSISHATLAGPKRVENDLADMICEAFLGDSYQEVSPKAYWQNVRHFVSSN